MEFLRYYGKVLRVAFSHSLDLAQAAIFVLVILAGLFTWLVPSAKMTIDLTGWQVAIVVLAAILLVRLLMAPVWLDSETMEKTRDLSDQLGKFTSVAPAIRINFGEGVPYTIESSRNGNAKIWQYQLGLEHMKGGLITQCQAQLESLVRPDGHEALPRKIWLCPPYTLRPGEEKLVHFLATAPDDMEKAITIFGVPEQGPHWYPFPIPVTFAAANYRLKIEALSAEGATARIDLELMNENGAWSMKRAVRAS